MRVRSTGDGYGEARCVLEYGRQCGSLELARRAEELIRTLIAFLSRVYDISPTSLVKPLLSASSA